LTAVCFVLAALCGPVPMVVAQPQLPAAVISAAVLSPEQITQVEDYVSGYMAGLADENKELIQQARTRLLDPLRPKSAAKPSVQFRQAYSNAMIRRRGPAALGELAASKRDEVAFSAVRLAGETATPDAAEIVVKALSDERPAVRIMAAAGLGRTFDALRESPPAIGVDGAIGLVDRLGQMVAAEQQPVALQEGIRALTAAMRVTEPGFGRLRPAAMAVMAKEVGQRAAKLGPDAGAMFPALLLAGQTARDALAAVNDPVLRLDRAGTEQALELSKHLVGYFMRRIKDFPQVDPLDDEATAKAKVENRVIAAQIIQVAESAAVVGLRTLLQRPVEAKNLAAEFRKATAEGDREFFKRALELVTMLEGR